MEQEQKVKFQLGDVLPISITLVVAGIAIAFGLSVMEDVQGDLVSGSTSYNATTDAIEGVAKIPEKLPLIVTVVVAALIIGILLRYMMFK
jgi:hypothetical protein